MMEGAPPVGVADAIERTAPDPSGAATPLPEPTDRDGLSFDPALHFIDPGTGRPALTKKGELKRRAGPMAKIRAQEKLRERAATLPPPPGGPQAQSTEIRFRTTAEVTVTSICGIAAMRGGPHWAANDAELSHMTDAWERYYRVRGIRDLPPEVGIISVTLAYVTANEKRRGDLRAIAAKIPNPFGGKNARSHSRANGVGKDAHSAAPSPRI